MTNRPRSHLSRLAGSIIRGGRVRLGSTVLELGTRSHVSRQMIGEIERGNANPTAAVLDRLFDALGLDIDLVVRHAPIVMSTRPRQTDAAHAITSGYVQRRLERDGWDVRREVRIDAGAYHGWIDLVAYHPESRVLLLIEIKTRVDDLGAIERTMDWYRQEVRRAVVGLGWRPRHVVPWLLVLATDEVEEQLRDNRAPLAAAFPARWDAMRALLGNPSAVAGPVRAGIALVDPRSRRKEWLIRSRIDGRRSDAPYRGYADFMRRSQRHDRDEQA